MNLKCLFSFQIFSLHEKKNPSINNNLQISLPKCDENGCRDGKRNVCFFFMNKHTELFEQLRQTLFFLVLP